MLLIHFYKVNYPRKERMHNLPHLRVHLTTNRYQFLMETKSMGFLWMITPIIPPRKDLENLHHEWTLGPQIISICTRWVLLHQIKVQIAMKNWKSINIILFLQWVVKMASILMTKNTKELIEMLLELILSINLISMRSVNNLLLCFLLW